MTHTPGTWRTLKSPHSKDIDILTSQGMIAEVFHRIDDETFADVESNARLIAAAPALLEALENALALCNDTVLNGNVDWEILGATANRIEQALAQARGE